MSDDSPTTGPDPDDAAGAVGHPSPFELLASAQEALAAQAEAVNQSVEGSAGGGVVKVRMSGGGEVTGLEIDPDVVDPDEVEMLQDLVLAALRDASRKVTELQQQALEALGQIDLGALGGSLGGLLGGDPTSPGGLGGLTGPTDPSGPTGSTGSPPD
jgi:nucleoid-associated protein EbfC